MSEKMSGEQPWLYHIIIAALLFLAQDTMAQTTQKGWTPAPRDNMTQSPSDIIWTSNVPHDPNDPHNVAALGKLCLFVLAMFSIFMFLIGVPKAIRYFVNRCQENQSRQAEQRNPESASRVDSLANARSGDTNRRLCCCFTSQPSKTAGDKEDQGVEMAGVDSSNRV